MRPRQSSQSPEHREGVFPGLVGLWLALALIKFGNPVIFAEQISAPSNREELLFTSWPAGWGYLLLVPCVVLGLRFFRWPNGVPAWLIAMPVLWLGWQGLSALQSVDSALSRVTLVHFAANVVAFYLGLFAFPQVHRARSFWVGLIGGLFVVLLIGLRQHFGGLEETRRFFYNLPDWQKYPPEFLKKVSSDRIYSTLFYPNTLAGVILLLLPPSLAILWESTQGSSVAVRVSLWGGLLAAGAGCLYWSGSKAGWLISMVLVALALLAARLKESVRAGLMLALVFAGLLGFWLAYRGYFQKGATSVSARMDYWEAAWQTMKTKPLLGTGPGTFMHAYKALKAPEAEMSRLVHNDYLQQGSDSGVAGLLAYAVFVCSTLALLCQRCWTTSGWRFGVWLGLAGAALQGFVEFGLYIPAVAWPTFFMSGWLLGTTNGKRFDKARADS